jgi:hypothetical protein
MIIYVDDQRIVRADYYDNEGHVIRYRVTSPGPGRVAFVSEPLADGSVYRVTYESAEGGSVKGAFAVGSTRSPDAWAVYLSWEMRRTPGR